jgi:hypothetical protein
MNKIERKDIQPLKSRKPVESHAKLKARTDKNNKEIILKNQDGILNISTI